MHAGTYSHFTEIFGIYINEQNAPTVIIIPSKDYRETESIKYNSKKLKMSSVLRALSFCTCAGLEVNVSVYNLLTPMSGCLSIIISPETTF